MVFKIIVGIDFGTTHSGVSWAVDQGARKIHLISDWPNPTAAVANVAKVPTTISYSNGQPYKWGYEVDMMEQNFRWFKLLLDPSDEVAERAEAVASSKKLLKSLNKTVKEVAADYLRLLWRYTQEHIQKKKGEDWMYTYTLQVVLTVPAIWSPAAKEKTLEVARAAGLPESILLVAEPEAAALRVLKEKHEEEEPLQVEDVFVVCDAGGGTVDLISYRITGINPLEVEECAVGDGGLCGSVFLDDGLEKHITVIVGQPQYTRISEKQKFNMRREFENGVKRAFDGDDRNYSVDLRGVADNKKEGIYDDTIKLSSTTLKTIFDFVINQIVVLVEKQIATIKRGGLCAKAMLLVGGFGANRYLYQRLKDAYRKDGIQILQADDAWSAVCIGATLWGLENSEQSTATTVVARLARHSYGERVSLPFDITKGHQVSDRFRSDRGSLMADNQMEWFLRKGERIHAGHKHCSSSCYRAENCKKVDGEIEKFSKQLYYCADDQPPSRFNTSCRALCKLEFGVDRDELSCEEIFTNPDTKEKSRYPEFVLEILFDSTILLFSISYKGKVLARKNAKYIEGHDKGESDNGGNDDTSKPWGSIKSTWFSR